MSALLDDIIATAIDNKQPLAVLLRKCLLLGHELKNERLKVWANQELSGYQNVDDLPPYRVFPAEARGNFSGPFQSGMRNWPIPPVALEKQHRSFAEQVFMMQAISELENATQSEGNLQFPWPGNLNVLYQTRFFQGRFVLISAWQEVSISAVVGLLDTVRNRTLNMALEIKDELGTSHEDLRSINSYEAAKVQNIIVQHIQGGTNYLNLGDATIDASTKTETVINIDDRKKLDEILIAAGLDATDLKKLTEAIQMDGSKKPGSKVGNWIKENASKVVMGGVKIGAKVGTEILVAWIKQYYGL